jgi:sodium-dependent dicarboxylate transporter 2/3/5
MLGRVPAALREFRPLQIAFLNLGPLGALLLVLTTDLVPGNRAATYTAALALWMALWWMSECAPLPVTSLLPVVFLPLAGVLAGEAVARQYFNSTVLLFLGGFLIALALQRWHVHRRLALSVLRLAGGNARLLLLAFMAATWFISWWVNNTATTMLLLPLALALAAQLDAKLGAQPAAGLGRALVLAAAYASSIGGLATPVGTPTNLILLRQYELLFPASPQLGFGHWMLFFVPLTAMMLLLTWLVLQWPLRRTPLRLSRDLLSAELRALGPLRMEERIVLAVFAAAALAWLTRAPLALGSWNWPGWGAWFTYPGADGLPVPYVDDGTVAIGLGMLLFLLPSRTAGAGGLMRWEDTRELPWGTVLLFGGGFALAEAFAVSGLGSWFGGQLAGLGGLHPLALIVAIYAVVTLLSEFASNTAAAQLILPIVASVAVALGLPPLLLMLAAANAASLDFVLPAATPPNAMALASGRVTAWQMVRTGVLVELLCLLCATLALYLLGNRLLP